MASRDLDAIWSVLQTEHTSSGLEVAGTGINVAAGEVLAGLEGDGSRHVLIPLLPGEAAITDTHGQAVHLIRVSAQGEQFVSLVCRSSDLHQVFTQFAGELIASVMEAPSPARAAIQVFDRWRALLAELAKPGSISDTALTGALGELLTVADLLKAGAPPDLRFWTGPTGSVHDVRSKSYALEVKSTLVRDGRVVPIASIEQLDSSPVDHLWLAHHRFDRDPSGFNIADSVQGVILNGGMRAALGTSLQAMGLRIDDLSGASDRRFRLVETRVYDVDSVAFPRVTRSSFVGEAVPPGTLRFSYSIDLTNQPPTPLSQAEVRQAYTFIAKDA